MCLVNLKFGHTKFLITKKKNRKSAQPLKDFKWVWLITFFLLWHRCIFQIAPHEALYINIQVNLLTSFLEWMYLHLLKQSNSLNTHTTSQEPPALFMNVWCGKRTTWIIEKPPSSGLGPTALTSGDPFTGFSRYVCCVLEGWTQETAFWLQLHVLCSACMEKYSFDSSQWIVTDTCYILGCDI